jgi:serine/threonine-protein kinase
MRIAAWVGDRDALARCRDLVPVEHVPQLARFRDYANVVLGDADPETLLEPVFAAANASTNARYACYVLQLGAEATGLAASPERAAECVARANDLALADLDWLERCPALSTVRELPDYEAKLHRPILARAQQLWVV